MQRLRTVEREHRLGKVYFLRSSGFVKVGITTGRVEDRVSTLAVGNPNPIEFLFAWVTPKYKEFEKAFHTAFASKKVRGEWFNMTESDLFHIDRLIDEVNATRRATV